MLQLLPDLVFPITSKQADALMVCITQLNLIEAGLTEPQQRALSLLFHCSDLWIKSGGRLDYRGQTGHARLIQDALAFVGTGNPVTTRHGDLAAAHLALDHNDAQLRLKASGQIPLSTDVNVLLNECRDLVQFPIEIQKRAALLMDYAGKRKLL